MILKQTKAIPSSRHQIQTWPENESTKFIVSQVRANHQAYNNKPQQRVVEHCRWHPWPLDGPPSYVEVQVRRWNGWENQFASQAHQYKISLVSSCCWTNSETQYWFSKYAFFWTKWSRTLELGHLGTWILEYKLVYPVPTICVQPLVSRCSGCFWQSGFRQTDRRTG